MGAGKWIGGILGFMTMGPLGALAGFALGSLLDGNNGLFGNTYEKGGQQRNEITKRCKPA
jgi:DnaJ like chaperone protein